MLKQYKMRVVITGHHAVADYAGYSDKYDL